MKGNLRAIIVLATAALSLALAAPANGDSRTARKQFEQAKRAYNIGHYSEALEGFEVVYRDTGDPTLLYNIGQCHRLLNHAQEAVKAYRAFLREFPTAPNRPVIEAQIRDLEEKLARDAKGSEGTPPGPDTVRTAAATPEKPLAGPETPPPPKVELTPVPAATERPAVLLDKPADARPAEPASSPFYSRWWFWTGVGVLVAGGATAFLLSRGGALANVDGTMEPKVVTIP